MKGMGKYMSSNNNNSGGLGFFSVITLIFITLKLTEVIDWSWWLVLLPFYGSIAFGLVILIAVIAIGKK
ncbi:hypothetical protein VPHF35G1_0044 [Vibrio phage F35 g1]|nr:putative transmembrane Fragile-X-F protein [Vibrio phage 115E34-1]